ncbi:MAG: hypothetical protein JWQ10_2154 [Herbaspirillum sp.]|jgi:hypothetical protein|nr:hypothetical protein [Herbaspirillum sp.]
MMIFITKNMPASDPNATERTTSPNWAKRVGWLLLIWSASVAALGVVALGLRLLMGLLGMSR